MSCQLWKPVLFDLARGITTAQTNDALLHVRECPECGLLLDQQQQLSELLRLSAVEHQRDITEVPQDLLRAFRASQIPKTSQSISWLRAAIFVMLMLGGWMWYRSHNFDLPKSISASQKDDGEFIPLQYAENPSNSFQVVRVQLGSSELQQLGFPGVPEWENRSVKADIVVGEDGLPHAIRFVTAETQR
jgi:hypothetical protein